MSKTQNSLPDGGSDAVAPEVAPERGAGPDTAAEGEGSGDGGAGFGALAGGPGLLCRPAQPRGRRSLFRR